MGKIVKKAKINWDHISEEEAERILDQFETIEDAINSVTYGSEMSAIKGITKLARLTNEEERKMIDDVYNRDCINEDIVNKIETLLENQGKEEGVIQILTNIHDEWVKNNANKFQARPKDYQFVDLRLLSFDEIKKDLIFLEPILAGCNIEINEDKLKKYFLDIQRKYMLENNISSHEELIEKLEQGSNFYGVLKGLKTNKGIEGGEEYLIDKLLENRNIVNNQAREIEQEIIELTTDLHTHLNGILPSEKLMQVAEKCGIYIDNIDEKNLEMPEKGRYF